MTIAKTISTITTIAALATSSLTGVSQAAEVHTLKPLHGLSFKTGAAHGVGFFQSERGDCKLVITFANDENADDAQVFTVTRHETLVSANQVTRYVIGDQPFEFGCQAGAAAMTFKPLSRLAAAESE